MAFSNTYDTATPAGSDDPAEADDRMREIKAAVQERENVDHYWPLTGTEVSDADAGEHRKVTLRTGSAPTAVANKGFVYAKDVGGKAELFYRDEDGNEVQLTSKGALLANDTYLKATDNAGTGSLNLLKATTGDILELLVGAVLSADTAPTVDAGIPNKKFVDDRIGLTYRYLPVDGSNTKVFTKYFTGNLDNDGETLVAHGITGVDNILAVGTAFFNSSSSTYYTSEMFRANVSAAEITVQYDGTNIIITNVGTQWRAQKYRIRIDYQ